MPDVRPFQSGSTPEEVLAGAVARLTADLADLRSVVLARTSLNALYQPKLVYGTGYVDTTETRSGAGSAAPGDLATAGPTVTISVGLSGAVFVAFEADTMNDTAGDNAQVYITASGANTIAASLTNPHINNVQQVAGVGALHDGVSGLLTGLTPGSTTFKLLYANNLGTATFRRRRLNVIAL